MAEWTIRLISIAAYLILAPLAADSRSPRDGKFIDEIGTYDPTKDPSEFKVDAEAAKKWLNNGAQPTETVGKIFKLAGIEK